MRLVCAAVVIVIAIAGCGSSGNSAKIDRAGSADATAAQVHSKLARVLTLHSYAGVSDVFTVATVDGGGQCSIDVIAAGSDAAAYSGDPDTLMSPDGQVAVKVGEFQGTPAAPCLTAVDRALGWH